MDKHEDYRWYVYKLVDPRSGAVFYVGKGCGDRAYQHERDARNQVGSNLAKEEVIRAIHAAGWRVGYEFDSYHCCEASSYDREAELIGALDGLTNIAKNKGAVRRKKEVTLLGVVMDCNAGRGDYAVHLDWLNKFSKIAKLPEHIQLIEAFSRYCRFKLETA